MTKARKSLISILILMILVASLTSCGNSEADTEITGNIIEVDISEATADYRDNRIFVSVPDPRTMSGESQQAMFDAKLELISKSNEQSFPEVETQNNLEKFSLGGQDIYALSADDAYESIILYIHGGAWISGIDQGHVNFCDKLVNELNAKVFMPLYNLAPQATAEENYEFLTDVYKELLNLGKPIIVMGDSAGATMAIGLVLELKDKGVSLPEKVVAMAPCADASFTNSEIQEVQKDDGVLPWIFCRECIKLWAGDLGISDQRISLINGNYEGFPDTLMYIGTYDVFYVDDIKLFEKMCDAGVNAEMVKGNGFWHVYLFYEIQEQPQFIQIMKDFCSD